LQNTGTEHSYSLDPIIDLFELKISNRNNQKKMGLYQNALRYAIAFEHNRIQNMREDGFENNGLVYAERNIETTLYYELYSPNSGSKELSRYSYNLEKINYLSYDTGKHNKEWAYIQLEQARSFLEKYVSFEGAKGNFEHYVLVKLALYLDCLENKCLVNWNIPNDLKYRERLLTDEEWNDLFTAN